ncbi:MAG: hypothetical protein Q9201_004262 [Fulgogasparrea decipioides]
MTELSCPFCPFSDPNPYALAEHVETIHPETDEPSFVPRSFLQDDRLEREDCKDTANAWNAPSQDYIECECGEAVPLSEFGDHVQLHSAESADMAVDTAEIILPSRPKQHSQHSHNPKHHHTVKDWVTLLLGPNASPSRTKVNATNHKNVKRLGRAELGPYAHEERMPSWLHKQLEHGARVSVINQISQDGQLVRMEVVANESRGILPVLAQLCEQDTMLSKVYLCHPGVQHVFKMAKEGGFCGYRNIQMMISFIQAAQSPGYEFFPGRVPSILDLQELIECAWDRGINTAGKVETGGIKGTRKYIGTPETLFISLNIGCEASAFNDVKNPPVFKQVYREVERYFASYTVASAEKVCRTSAPPIYFQHQGHSLTIVGLEMRKSGSRNLLVFDPSFKPSPGIQRLIGSEFRAVAPEKLLKAYRRGDNYLGKHSSFEILKYGTAI